jgi:two-component system, OmpR family, manganese sensing sensor histidine kinase
MISKVFTQTRRKLTFWYALVMGVILLFASGIFLKVVQDGQIQAVDRSLETLISSFAGQEGDGHLNERNFTLTRPHPDIQEDFQRTALAYARSYDNQGKLLWEREQKEGDDDDKEAPVNVQRKPRLGFGTIEEGEGRYRQLTVKIPDGILQIGLSLDEADEVFKQILLGLLVTIPLLQGVIALAAWLLAGSAMVPIRQAYERLQQFTADASHELRTPVATILTTAQSAVQTGQLTPQQSQAKFTAIVETAQRMGVLTNDLLWLARADRVGAGEQPKLEQCSLKTILSDLYEELAPQAEAKKLKFICHLPETDPRVQGYEDQLYRLFTNLIVNAIKYTPTGGKVEIHLTQAAQAEIKICDSGIGISAQHLPQLFERFYRVDESRIQSAGGTGLGLAIAKQIVETHQGEITVSSTLGEGSAFTVHLPVVQ